MADKPNALVLYALPGETAGTVTRYIHALETMTGFKSRSLNIAWQLPSQLDLDRFDVVVIHYSLMASEDAIAGPISLSAAPIARIGNSRAVKCVFMQDEHRNVKQSITALRALGADLFFTCTPSDLMAKIYPSSELPGTTLINVLTGYVDENFLQQNPKAYADRHVDVGYRARKVAFWLGRLAQEKWTIAERFLADARKFGLVCDISTREGDRLYGKDWADFLGNCKAILGTESGASIVDIDGGIRATVDGALRKNPALTFEDVERQFLLSIDGKFSMAQISPRCFEAAASKTLMILYEGSYSGRLEAWKHYVPLKKDHSNMSVVIDVLRDDARAQAIIENAYNDCALGSRNSYAALQELVETAIAGKMIGRSLVQGYSDQEWRVIEADNRKIFERARWLRAANGILSRALNAVLPTVGAALRDRIARPLRAALLRR